MQELKSQQLKLYYETHGNGRPVLLIHGFGENIYSWKYLIDGLCKNYKIIAIDLKGFGKSPKPKDKKYSANDQANLILNFIIENNLQNITLIGHSFGGAVSLITTLKLIENNQNRLSSLVLLDSPGYPQKLPNFIKILSMPILGPLLSYVVPAVLQVRFILKLAYYDDKKISQESINAYSAPINMPGGRYALIETAKQVIPSDIDQINAGYKTINIPTLILWGRQDAIIPLSIGERLHGDIKNSKLVIIEKCGHLPQEEKASEVIDAIIGFFNSVNKNWTNKT